VHFTIPIYCVPPLPQLRRLGLRCSALEGLQRVAVFDIQNRSGTFHLYMKLFREVRNVELTWSERLIMAHMAAL
jgi:hypothetical protein